MVTIWAILTVASGEPANAQGGPNPPPRSDTISPTGVSLATGAFNHEERDLAIGGGAFPAGLTLERSYLSSLASQFSAYAGYRTQGWNSNLNVRVGNSIVPTPWQQPPPGTEHYVYSVSIGNRSVGFTGGTTYPTGGFVGIYEPVQLGGEILEFGGGDHTTGQFTFTDSDGTVMIFNSQTAAGAPMAVSSITAPDGTRAEFTYDDVTRLRSVISNRGYALLFEYGSVGGTSVRTKACAVNMATTYVTALSSCPAGAQTVTYHYSAGSSGPMLTGFTNAAGHMTSYRYDARGHLDCIMLPGQGCGVVNTYSICEPPPPPDNEPQQIPPDMTTHEQVLSQTTAANVTYTYSFQPQRVCPDQTGPSGLPTEMRVNGVLVTTVELNNENVPSSVTERVSDAVSRTTQYGYIGRDNWSFLNGEHSTVSLIIRPEQNRVEYEYDGRGNLGLERLVPKPGSTNGEVPITRTALYPTDCSNRRTCNRPERVTDPRTNHTLFTYDPTHGGVLTETGPPDANGVEPQVRYTYQQRYAWIRNASGGYSPAATPVWVRVSESRCRTTRPIGSPCALAGDEVVTTYDYGPNSGPNNLLPRSVTVSGDNLSSRTCYGYDTNGNRISETRPGGVCQ